MQKMIVTMMALALTVSTQVQAQEDGGLADLKADMMAAMINQDSIDTSSLVAVYDYECHTQDADGKPVTDRMKLCLLVGQHCTRSFPYRKFRKEREWADGEERAATDFIGLKGREYLGGYDFFSEEELPLLRSESYCHVPEVWMNHPDGQVSVRDAIPPTIYETREERKPIKWELGERTATCELHGVKWTVRYDEDIPTTAGPWKLCGLPGLITEAVSDGGIHRFTLIDLQRTAAPIYYETSAITVRTSEEKLIKNRIKTFGNRLYLKNPWGFISDHSNADKVHDTEGSLINGVYMHNRPHVFQPLDCK
jgi:GLPGLI family protein